MSRRLQTVFLKEEEMLNNGKDSPPQLFWDLEQAYNLKLANFVHNILIVYNCIKFKHLCHLCSIVNKILAHI